MVQATTHVGRPKIGLVPTEKRVRARIGGHIVADSRAARLLVRGHPRAYVFPRDDVDERYVATPGAPTQDPDFGAVRRAAFEVDGRNVPDGVRYFDHDDARDVDLSGLAWIPWDRADAWYEEDDEVYVHPRDPYHRVDVLTSSRHVVVEVDGETVAETRRPMLLFETGLPVRTYFPQTDVRLDLLRPSETTTGCPYKGYASYHHVDVDGKRHDDLVWCYRAPFDEARRVQGFLAFFDERADVTVDGETQMRPHTMWSR